MNTKKPNRATLRSRGLRKTFNLNGNIGKVHASWAQLFMRIEGGIFFNSTDGEVIRLLLVCLKRAKYYQGEVCELAIMKHPLAY